MKRKLYLLSLVLLVTFFIWNGQAGPSKLSTQIWAVHDRVDRRAGRDARWAELEVKLAECAEQAQDLEGK